jgi:hypothetical protein
MYPAFLWNLEWFLGPDGIRPLSPNQFIGLILAMTPSGF